MPAAVKRYYNTKDVQTILGCGRMKANEIMHKFDAKGLLFRDGREMFVRIEVFEKYLKDNERPHDRIVI